MGGRLKLDKKLSDYDRLFADALIEQFDGTSKVAALCEVRPPSITAWRTKGVPHAWNKYFKLLNPKLYRAAERAAAKAERLLRESPAAKKAAA